MCSSLRSSMAATGQTVFLDRDGVINRDSPNYITSWDQFVFLPGSLDAICRLTQAGMTVMVITNQSAVGRGMLDIATLDAMHRHLRQAVDAAGRSDRRHFLLPAPSGRRVRLPQAQTRLDPSGTAPIPTGSGRGHYDRRQCARHRMRYPGRLRSHHPGPVRPA